MEEDNLTYDPVRIASGGGAYIFHSRNAGALYPTVLETVLEEGADVAPRGIKTKELRPVMLQIDRPWECLVSMPGRNLNPFFLMAEVLWLLAGRSDARFITYYNQNLLHSLDDDGVGKTPPGGPYFHGAYGERLRRWGDNHKRHEYRHEDTPIDQLKGVIDLLTEQRDSRQAVMSIWNPSYDLGVRTKDFPCNNIIYFKVRNDRLHMTVCNRSNDVNWGLLSTNVVQFSMLQQVVAACLKLPIGGYTHITDSLHVYLDKSYEELAGKQPFPLYFHAPERGWQSPETPIPALPFIDTAIAYAIERLFELRVGGPVDEQMAVDIAERHHAVERVPIVRDFIRLLAAYTALKRDEYGAILPSMEMVEYCDWKVMATEYLYRALLKRTKKHGIAAAHVNLRHELAELIDDRSPDAGKYVRGEWPDEEEEED